MQGRSGGYNPQGQQQQRGKRRRSDDRAEQEKLERQKIADKRDMGFYVDNMSLVDAYKLKIDDEMFDGFEDYVMRDTSLTSEEVEDLRHKCLVTPDKGEKILCKSDYTRIIYDAMHHVSQEGGMLRGLEVGEVLTGTVAAMDSHHIYVDCGHKDYIVSTKRDENADMISDVKVGDEVEITVTSVQERPHYRANGSISAEYYTKLAGEIDRLIVDEVIVNARVRSWTASGYLLTLEYKGVKFEAFMPNTLAGVNKLADPSSLVDQDIMVILESYTPENRSYIASRKKYLEGMIGHEAQSLTVGSQRYTGTVTGTTNFGVFVEFNECLTGLINLLNMDDETKAKLPSMKPGDQVSFFVKEVILNRNNPSKTKIVLAQVDRATMWDTVKTGDSYTGTVKSVIPHGCLVNLDDETMGLVHNSEIERMKWNPVVGSSVQVFVTQFDRENRKIMLSLSAPKKHTRQESDNTFGSLMNGNNRHR